MATLDEFIKQSLKHSQSEGDDNLDSCFCGGWAIMIAPDKQYSVYGLGVVNAIAEFLDNPKFSADSESFRPGLLEVGEEEHSIFKSYSVMRQAVSCGLLVLTPKDEDYEAIKRALDDLYSKFQAFQNGLPDEKKGIVGIVENLRATVEKIRGAETPEETMRLISEEGGVFRTVADHIPWWVSEVLDARKSDEYQGLKSAYDTLRDACRSANYWVHVPEDLKQNQFLQQALISNTPNGADALIITDTPEELKTLARAFAEGTAADSAGATIYKKILYRGLVNGDTLPVLDAFRKDDYSVICEQIKGPAQYREWLEREGN
jgi:hypothetical protein